MVAAILSLLIPSTARSGMETLQALVTAALAAGTVPIVRVGGPDPRQILCKRWILALSAFTRLR